MKPIIRVENLSKQYCIGAQQKAYLTLRESLIEMARKPFNVFRRGNGANEKKSFWALKDISFEVMPGEVVGIIGRNGAGKSTLLKILSRITEPTRGRIELFGRIGSLLEVGTGFHPELTGRENIFLNGAILGMKREEINKKFDEIVDFAEVEDFLDTPVKRYSSGMQMRLAFAVAANLDPEILVVDEVLAVGDAQFQKKCMGKMGEVSKGGRTIFFVSHNAAALSQLCKTVIYLEKGTIKNQGDVKSILAQHQSNLNGGGSEQTQLLNELDVKEGEIRYINWRFENADSNFLHTIFSREPCHIILTLVCRRELKTAHLGIVIQDEMEQKMVVGHNLSHGAKVIELKQGIYEIHWQCDLPLKAGDYRIIAAVGSPDEGGIVEEWLAEPKFTVLPKSDNSLPKEWQGVLNVPVTFEIKQKVS